MKDKTKRNLQVLLKKSKEKQLIHTQNLIKILKEEEEKDTN